MINRKKIIVSTISVILALTVKTNNVFAAVNRLGGIDRYETSKYISSQFNQSDTAIIVTGTDYPDALSATPLAGKYNAPILLTQSKYLNDKAESELKRLNVKNVFIVGGEGVVSAQVFDKIASFGIQVERISGANRYETSVEVAKKIGTSNGVIVTTGLNYADALSIGPVAAIKQMPIILSNGGNKLNTYTENFIKSNNISKSFIIGGEGAVSNSISTNFPNPIRISGSDRYETNEAILNYFKNDMNFNNAFVAVGNNFPDALSGGALASLNRNPIILTNSNKNIVGNLINANSIRGITILGSNGVISNTLENDFRILTDIINKNGQLIKIEDNNDGPEEINLAKVESYIIELTNKERQKNSKITLKLNETMKDYAKRKGEDMVNRNYFDHIDPNNKYMYNYMAEEGVYYFAWGENLSYNSGYKFKNSYELAKFFVEGWMNSPGHRENILNNNFEEIGVSVIKTEDRYYGIQEFYTPLK